MSEPRTRLVICELCKTVRAVPWCGTDKACRHPRCNDVVNAELREHEDGRTHSIGLVDVPEADWDSPDKKQHVLRMIAEASPAGKASGLGAAFYAVKETYKEDAARCWKAHNRTLNCQDYMSDKKALYNPEVSKAERKDVGLSPRGVSTYLCDFCPYKSIVMQRVRDAQGHYDFKG